MSRLVVLGFLAACSSKTPEAAPPPPPVVAAKPVVAPIVHSTLDGSEALTYLRLGIEAVVIAGSYQQLDAALGISALSILPAPPPGLSRTKPIGLAWSESAELIAFGYVDDERALRAAFPKVVIRGPLAFFGNKLALAEVHDAPAKEDTLASYGEFTESVHGLHGGALVSWWIDSQGAVGIDGDATQLHVSAEALAVPRSRDDEKAIRAGEARGKSKKLNAARDAADAAHAKLDAVRGPAIDEAAKALGLVKGAKLPVDFTFTPPGGVKAWVANLANAWQAPELAKAVADADKDFVAVRDARVSEAEAQAQKFADLLSAGEPERGTPGDIAMRRSGADLGGQIADVREAPSGVATGGTVRVGTGAGPSPHAKVKLDAGGDAGLHGFLAQRLARVQNCFDQESGRRVSIAITTDATGLVTAKATGDAASCVELAVRGTSPAQNASGTFTFEVSP